MKTPRVHSQLVGFVPPTSKAQTALHLFCVDVQALEKSTRAGESDETDNDSTESEGEGALGLSRGGERGRGGGRRRGGEGKGGSGGGRKWGIENERAAVAVPS